MKFPKMATVCTSAVFAAVLACSKNPAQGPQAAGMQAMPVKVMEARALPVNDASEYVATLKSRDSAVIMPQVDGQITQISVHSGENVSAGTALMEIDPLKQQATVKSLEGARTAQQATLSWTTQQYERAKGLAAAGVVRSVHRYASRKCSFTTTKWWPHEAESSEMFRYGSATGSRPRRS
jgi:multidrug efflux pump subunit AcrA (membrane-fusion protein)